MGCEGESDSFLTPPNRKKSKTMNIPLHYDRSIGYTNKAWLGSSVG